MPSVEFSNRVYEAEPSESVLDTLLRNGENPSYSCRKGTCFNCMMRTPDGGVPEKAQAGLRETLRVEGYFLSCLCVPEGDIRVVQAEDAAIYQRAVGQAQGAHALVALGGYGRSEMAPYSDVDLLFLFKKDQDKVPEFVSGVLNPLWDMGFEVGHSSRTLAEVAKFAREDLESCTAMMDGRLLAGDEALFAEFQQRLYKKVPKRTIGQLDAWRRQRIEARQSVQLLDPNVKESPGGLREMQIFDCQLLFQLQILK